MEKCLGKNLKYLREIRGWMQSEMKDRLDIKASTWGMYENDKSQPNIDGLIYIAKYFGVSETDLLHTDLKENAHLISKITDAKKHEIAHPIAHPIAHLKHQKEVKSKEYQPRETAFKFLLNEDQAAFKHLPTEVSELYSKLADFEQKTTSRIQQIEATLQQLLKQSSKIEPK